jgi:membrane-bound lytic murein transglycosylase B
LSALFALRDSKAIPFERALAYAKEASNGTGVRPAFILAILTQETNLGANVGTCNRPGDPATKSWKNIMKPTRDIEPYLRIVKSLGITPESMPLSCPQGNGYGGAMGPSQFIPSTWELYTNRVSVVTGNRPANPWNAEDAFAATSVYLKDLGADARTYAAESRAAGKYYAGSRWATAGVNYSNSVMAIATRIQGNIDILAE